MMDNEKNDEIQH